MNKYCFIDCETSTLRGEVFAVNFMECDHDFNIIKKITYRCDADIKMSPWVRDNVLPAMEEIPQTHVERKDFLADCAAVVKKAAEEGTIWVAHCGSPVESNFFQRLFESGLIGEFEQGLLIDPAFHPEVGWSVEGFLKGRNIALPEGNRHHPEFDNECCRLTMKELYKMF